MSELFLPHPALVLSTISTLYMTGISILTTYFLENSIYILLYVGRGEKASTERAERV